MRLEPGPIPGGGGEGAFAELSDGRMLCMSCAQVFQAYISSVPLLLLLVLVPVLLRLLLLLTTTVCLCGARVHLEFLPAIYMRVLFFCVCKTYTDKVLIYVHLKDLCAFTVDVGTATVGQTLPATPSIEGTPHTFISPLKFLTVLWYIR